MTPYFPDEVLEVGRKHFAATDIEHEIKTYPEVPHGMFELFSHEKRATVDIITGFAVYGDYDSPDIERAQAAAFQQMLNWLKSH